MEIWKVFWVDGVFMPTGVFERGYLARMFRQVWCGGLRFRKRVGI